MMLYGSKSPKRHVAWSNSEAISKLHTGPLNRGKATSNAKGKTYRTYIDKSGHQRFHGTKFLKGTQILAYAKAFSLCYGLFYSHGDLNW
jgi:hypothetical protein